MHFVWNWPQIAWAVIVAINLVMGIIFDGEPKGGRHSFAVTLFAAVTSFGIMYFGGFFAGAAP